MAKKKNITGQVYNFNDPNTVEYLTGQKHKFEARRDKAADDANNTERALAGQLILLTTVLITINVVALNNSDLLNHLTTNQRILILLAFLLEAVSTFAGILQYLSIEASYNKWADAYHKISLIIQKKDFSTSEELAKMVDDTQNNLPIHNSKPWLKMQVASILTSFVVYFVLLVAVLFDFHNYFTIWR
jgi:hypothetical protein